MVWFFWWTVARFPSIPMRTVRLEWNLCVCCVFSFCSFVRSFQQWILCTKKNRYQWELTHQMHSKPNTWDITYYLINHSAQLPRIDPALDRTQRREQKPICSSAEYVFINLSSNNNELHIFIFFVDCGSCCWLLSACSLRLLFALNWWNEHKLWLLEKFTEVHDQYVSNAIVSSTKLNLAHNSRCLRYWVIYRERERERKWRPKGLKWIYKNEINLH